MAGLSQFFFYLYALTIIFFACLYEILLDKISSASKFLSTSLCRPVATARFLKLLDKENPTRRYRIRKWAEAPEEYCTVCLSRLERGEKIRNLKCNHTFHKVCVDTWLQQDSAVACPLCRRVVLSEEVMVKLRQRLNGDRLAYGGSDDEEIIFLLNSLQGSNGELQDIFQDHS